MTVGIDRQLNIFAVTIRWCLIYNWRSRLGRLSWSGCRCLLLSGRSRGWLLRRLWSRLLRSRWGRRRGRLCLLGRCRRGGWLGGRRSFRWFLLRLSGWFLDAILLTEGMSDQIMLRNDIILHGSCRVVGILWEVSVARVIVFFLCIVALHMVSWVVYRVFIMVNSGVLIQIIVVCVAHWVVEVEQVVMMVILQVSMLVMPLGVTPFTSRILKAMLKVLLVSVFITFLIIPILLVVFSGFCFWAFVLPFILSFITGYTTLLFFLGLLLPMLLPLRSLGSWVLLPLLQLLILFP